MAAYLITYDLNRPGQDYNKLFDAIRSVANGYLHVLDSTWIVGHTGPATVIRDHLTQFIDRNDRLLVARLSGEAAWQLGNDASEWLHKHL